MYHILEYIQKDHLSKIDRYQPCHRTHLYSQSRRVEFGQLGRTVEACASLLMGEGTAVLQCERNSSSESDAQWPTWGVVSVVWALENMPGTIHVLSGSKLVLWPFFLQNDTIEIY